MIRIVLLLAALFVVVSTSGASAQDVGTPMITRGQLEPAMPTLRTEDMLSKEMANALFKQCRSFYPRRFTPTALDSYCECAMVSTQATMSAKEYADIQVPRNQKASNSTYQKDITNVVAPCMVRPTIDIEYLSCALDRSGDNRISSLPKYCQCVAKDVSDHVALYGDVDILISMGSNQRITDPFEALWINSKYLQSMRNARIGCLGNYMKQRVQYDYN